MHQHERKVVVFHMISHY